MYELKSLDDVRGNNVVVYSIRKLLEAKSFPKLSIMSGVMGVGKTSVAKIVAEQLNASDIPVKSYNFGSDIDMQSLQEEVFSMNPAKARAFIFEELHGLSKSSQTALLQMFDNQSSNVYVICTTTKITNVLNTIRSRAQVWEFKLLSEKQLLQLLDDYLKMQNAVLTEPSKTALLKSCHGVPRDLIKNTDFALAGSFNSQQLDALLGNVSDDLMYAIFCTLKSNTVDFVANIENLMDEASSTKLEALRDFWLRYLLERSGAVRCTLKKEMIQTLDRIYVESDMGKVAKMLLRATPDTLLLELVSMNVSLRGATPSEVIGHQKDAAARNEREMAIERQRGQQLQDASKVTSASLKEFKL